jgi:dipeptidase D
MRAFCVYFICFSCFILAALSASASASVSAKAKASAAPAPDRTHFPSSCLKHAPECEIDLFRQLSGFYRPSGEEAQVTAYLIALAKDAEKNVWHDSTEFSVKSDALGNVLVTLPAVDSSHSLTTASTQKFSGETIALQAHTDMVTAVQGLAPGEDPHKYFFNGVVLEEKDGWLQSKDRKTSIGADDGFGVALALRYLADNTLPHPPLELIFTVQEETGLVGANAFSLPLKARRFINLDGNSGNALVVGTQGGSSHRWRGDVELGKVASEFKIYQVTLTDLKGGHSGMAIHLPRANAIQVAAELVRRMKSSESETHLARLVGGNEKILNQIPNSFELVVATTNQQLSTDWITETLKTIIKKSVDEDLARVAINVMVLPNTKINAMSEKSTGEFIQRLLAVPHGVMAREDKYPNAVKTSTSFASVKFSGDDARSKVNMGFLSRSFKLDELLAIAERSSHVLKSQWPGKITQELDQTYIPWEMDPSSPMAKAALENRTHFKKQAYLAGGIETSSFLKKYPNMEMVAFGGDILDQHTPNERVRMQSFPETAQALARLLATFAKNPDGLK